MMRLKTTMICQVSCLAALMGVCTFLPVSAWSKDTMTPPASAVADPHIEDQHPQEQILIHIYFADRFANYLQAEERILSSVSNTVEKGRLIVEALIKGPKSGLTRTIPVGTQLNAFYLGQGGQAYVDLSENVTNNGPGGCRSEILAVYSIVNSLVLNLPEIEWVMILVNGRETPTLSGHIDNRFSFNSDMLLIR